MSGALGRARAALATRDFRWLLAARLASQLGDGVFQAFLIDKLVFLSPDKQSTTAGVARALALLIIPFSLVGPFTGVVIDRWSRRRILLATPLLRGAVVIALLPVAGLKASFPLYALALIALSTDRFYLATAGAVMPALVPDEDLLIGNAMASAMGTVATFTGLVAGTQLADVMGTRGLLWIDVVLWPLSGFLAWRMSAALRAARTDRPLGGEVARVVRDLWHGARRLAATPPALGSIVSISLDQFLIGIVTVLGVVVFKEEFNQGVASYGRILAAGGVGVLVGTATVGLLEERLAKPRIMAVAFAAAGAVCLLSSARIVGPTILAVSFTLGLTYTWRKMPADTIVQESLPDRFRGRVFALYDLAFSLPRVLAALAAVALIPHLSPGWILAAAGLAYLAWAPIAPWWVARPQLVRLRFYAGGSADEVPRAMLAGGREEPVELLGSWLEERGGVRRRKLRLRCDGLILDLVESDRGGLWRIEREIASGPTGQLAAPAP